MKIENGAGWKVRDIVITMFKILGEIVVVTSRTECGQHAQLPTHSTH